MTAASISLGHSQRASRRQLALAMLGVCLPVPVFAATGLSLPLPSAIERLAVSLVPWANASALDANQALARGTAGTIPLDGEQSVQVSVGEDGTLVVVRVPRQKAKSSTGSTRNGDERVSAGAALPIGGGFGFDRRGGTTPPGEASAPAATPAAPGPAPAAQAPAPAQEAPAAQAPAPAPTQSGPEPSAAPSAVTAQPAPASAPAPAPVVAPVVEEVVSTVDTTVGVVEDVVNEVVAPVVAPVVPLPPLPPLLPGLGLGK
jgi:hypothetical protein